MRRVRAFGQPRLPFVGFVAVAVALAVAIVSGLNSGGQNRDDGRGAGTLVAAGSTARGSATSTDPARQTYVFDSSRTPAQVAAENAGAPGTLGPASELVPLTPQDFAGPIARYRRFAWTEAGRVVSSAGRLTAALRAGNRSASEAAWNATDSAFARVGAAYGALGRLGQQIDGAPGGLPGGTHDPQFAGLQRIELGLWDGAPPRSLVPVARRLEASVARLRRATRTAPITPLIYATRAHEILEDVQRDRLAIGSTPSDSGVRATADAVFTTRVVLGTLRPLLNGRGNALTESDYYLKGLTRELNAIRAAHGGRYPTVASLGRVTRETLDGRVGATLEALSGIPGELETKTVPQVREGQVQ